MLTFIVHEVVQANLIVLRDTLDRFAALKNFGGGFAKLT